MYIVRKQRARRVNLCHHFMIARIVQIFALQMSCASAPRSPNRRSISKAICVPLFIAALCHTSTVAHTQTQSVHIYEHFGVRTALHWSQSFSLYLLFCFLAVIFAIFLAATLDFVRENHSAQCTQYALCAVRLHCTTDEHCFGSKHLALRKNCTPLDRTRLVAVIFNYTRAHVAPCTCKWRSGSARSRDRQICSACSNFTLPTHLMRQLFSRAHLEQIVELFWAQVYVCE